MEQFNNTSSFNASAAAPTPTTTNTNNNTNETTYSFTASTGEEDFSTQAPLHVPQYGASRDDPYYTAINNQDGQQHQQQYPTSIQDKASVALASTGETMKSLWGAGVSGAQVIGGMARDKMSGGNTNTHTNNGGMGERTYNNNFLLRDDSEHGGSGMMMDHAATMSSSSSSSQLPPPPVSAAVASGSDAYETTTTSSGHQQQAYSMLKYGKTFCEDVFGFVMQLPPWGKGVVAVIVLWALYVVFG